MLKTIIRNGLSGALASNIKSSISSKMQKTVKQNLESSVLEAFSLTKHIFYMENKEIIKNINIIKKELNFNKNNENNKIFVQNNLKTFRENLIKTVLTDNNKVNDMTNYILKTPSKLFRPSISLFTFLLLKNWNNTKSSNFTYYSSNLENNNKEEMEKIMKLCYSYELVHIGSLVHDDILDESDLRRNVLTLHKKVGIKSSVLIGDLLLSKSASLVSSLDDIRIVKRLSKTLESLIQGELMEVNLDEEVYINYFQKIYLKTACLIANNISCVSLLLNLGEEMEELLFKVGLHIGLSFQICDDLLDYTSTVNNSKKPVLSDINSGLVTLPLIYSVENDFSNLEQIKNLLKNRKVENILKIMENKNYMEKCKLSIFLHLQKAKYLLERFNSEDSNSLLNYVFTIVTRS